MQEISAHEEPLLESDRLWKIDDLMGYLGVSESQARKFYQEDGLPVVVLGPKEYRFIPESVKEWAKEHEQVLRAS